MNILDKFSASTWKKHYQIDKNQEYDVTSAEERYAKELKKFYFDKFFNYAQGDWFLEIGAGNGAVIRIMSGHIRVVSMDISFDACKMMKKNASTEVRSRIICGDIWNLPFKDEVFFLIYGGGVIEHFTDTSFVIRSLARICQKKGGIFMTVPRISFLTLTVAQLWGNIPDIFPLRELATYIHFRLLKGKHMRFGLEKSFLQRSLRYLFQKNGFKYTHSGVFYIYHSFSYFKSKNLRLLLNAFINLGPLNHHIYILGKKNKNHL